jgi:uncharacterized radical SAM superfamily protein
MMNISLLLKRIKSTTKLKLNFHVKKLLINMESDVSELKKKSYEFNYQ